MLPLLAATTKILAINEDIPIDRACLPCFVPATSALVGVDFLQTNML
jgi:hypothetical protein